MALNFQHKLPDPTDHGQATIECGFTLKRVRDMTRTYSQDNRSLGIPLTECKPAPEAILEFLICSCR